MSDRAQILLRVSLGLKARVTDRAAADGLSVNAWAARALLAALSDSPDGSGAARGLSPLPAASFSREPAAQASSLAGFATEIEAARRAIFAVLDGDPEKWWPADELRDAAGVHGPPAMYAICSGANADALGALELDSHLRVRRAR